MKRTYGAIHHNGEAWCITDIEPHVAMRAKALFPRIPKTGRVPFVLQGGPQIDADLVWFMSRYPLKISDKDHRRMRRQNRLFKRQQDELLKITSDDYVPNASIGFRGNLRPYRYQAQAADLAQKTGRLLLMDDLGLGKTISALATITNPDYLPALVVPQTHLVTQWEDRIAEFTGLRTHAFKKSKPYKLPEADVYLCPYSKLAGWIDYAETAGFKSIIFDEIQELRNGRTTAKGSAAFAFREFANLSMGLTATPIYNYGSEIFEVVNFIEPGAFGTWFDFQIEWCAPGPGGKWLVKDPQALGTYLREQHIALRRTSEDVGDERKDANVITHEVPYDHKIIDDKDAFIRDLAKRVMSGTFTQRGQAAREFDLLLRKATGIAKAPHVAAFVRILLESDQPVLLFGWHRDVYDIWLRQLSEFSPMLYTGTESARQKERTKAAFLGGDTNLMIMSLRSGAGVDGLQERCRTAVFGELDWSPKVMEQCVGRLNRPGQLHQVDAIYLHADGGADPSMFGVLGLKASQSQGIVDPLKSVPDQQSDSTRIRELAEQYLKTKATPEPTPEMMEV